MAAVLTLGAPGIYSAPPARPRTIAGARMDVCAFLGVAPRGPARVPLPGGGRRRSVAVAVESFDEYRRLYGGFEGPGRLPYAVASFFEQGGRRAYVVRIVPDDAGAGRGAGTARGTLAPLAAPAGGLTLWARSEGAWGNGLRPALRFAVRPVELEPRAGAELTGSLDLSLPAGTLLRLRAAGGATELRFVEATRVEGHPREPRRQRVLTLDAAPAAAPVGVEVVDAALEVDDGAGRFERHAPVGLSPEHPRWLGRVLRDESELVEPDEAWAGARVAPAGPELAAAQTPPVFDPDQPPAGAFADGADRFHDISPEDFFDPAWVLGDDEPGSGVHALADAPEVAVVVAPDLYDPDPLPDPEQIVSPPTLAGPRFRRCVEPARPPEQQPPPRGLERLALDPTVGADRRRIVALQRRLHDLADLLRDWVVLLDVPPRLGQAQVLRWRASFGSPFAAVFHPWLRVARPDDERGRPVQVNPAAVAAGIIARRELAAGVQFGPANVLAARVVDVADRVTPERHDELHPSAVNVFAREADGVRLTAARTLARNPAYRQLSVRRLVSMIERTLPTELAWTVFEPNGPSLRADVTQAIESYLRGLYLANAFTGATEAEAFFVRCDDHLNPQPVADAGQLVAEIGIAPAEPLEFIVLRLSRDGDGTLIVDGGR